MLLQWLGDVWCNYSQARRTRCTRAFPDIPIDIRFFKQYDTNGNGVLEYAEVERLANDLFLTLGISLEEGRLKECFLAQQIGVFVLQDLGWNLEHVGHDMFSEKAMTDWKWLKDLEIIPFPKQDLFSLEYHGYSIYKLYSNPPIAPTETRPGDR